MADEITTTDVEETTETTEENQTTAEKGQSGETLGEGGKKALEAERKARREAEKKAKRADELEAELAKFQEDAMSDQEKAIEQARTEAADAARQEVMSELRQDRLLTRVEAAATGKFADPKDAAAFLDLTDLDPDDPEAITAEVDRVLEAKPYLKASATQAPGDIDQGPRGNNGPMQLTREDLKTMTPEQISAAKKEGRFEKLLGQS